MTVYPGRSWSFSSTLAPQTLLREELWGMALLEPPVVAEDAAASVYPCCLSAGGCHPAARLITHRLPAWASPLRVKASSELSIKMCWRQGGSRRSGAARQGCTCPSLGSRCALSPAERQDRWLRVVVFCGGKAEDPHLVTETLEVVFRQRSTAVFCSKFLWWQGLLLSS